VSDALQMRIHQRALGFMKATVSGEVGIRCGDRGVASVSKLLTEWSMARKRARAGQRASANSPSYR